MSQPFVDAMLPDGSRLHVVIPDMIDARCLTSAEVLDCLADLGKCR